MNGSVELPTTFLHAGANFGAEFALESRTFANALWPFPEPGFLRLQLRYQR